MSDDLLPGGRRHAHRACHRLLRADGDCGAGHEADAGQVAQLFAIVGEHLLYVHALAHGDLGERSDLSRGDAAVGGGNRIAVWVELGVTERLGHAFEDAVGDGVFEAFGFDVDLVPAEAEPLDEVCLENAMAPDDAQGRIATGGREGDATVRDVVDEALLGEAAEHAADRGRGDGEPGRDVGGRGDAAAPGEDEDGLEVILDGGGEGRDGHQSVLIQYLVFPKLRFRGGERNCGEPAGATRGAARPERRRAADPRGAIRAVPSTATPLAHPSLGSAMSPLPLRSRRAPTLVGTVAFLLGASASSSLAAQGAPRAFTTEDALDVRTVRVEDVTRDGRWIAASVSTRRDRSGVDHFRYGDPTYVAPSRGDLLVIDATSGQQRALFPAKEQLRGATWSPDGTMLAFFRRDGDAFRLHVHEAASGRTRAITLRGAPSISSQSPLVWAPDGTQVLITLRSAGWADSAHRAFVALSEGPIVVQQSSDPFLDWDRVRGMAAEEQLALVTLATGAVRPLPITRSVTSPRFTADGTSLVYGLAEPRRTSYERAKGTWFGLYRLRLRDLAVDTLLSPREQRLTAVWNEAATRVAWTDRGNVFVRALDADSAVNLTAAHRTPRSTSDTSRLAFSIERWRPDGNALLLASREGLHLLDVSDASLRTVLAYEGAEDTRPRLASQGWSADGASVFLSTSARDRWERGLLRLDVATGAIEVLRRDAALYADWTVSADGSRVVYRQSDGDRPDEVYTADIRFRAPQRLTTLNPQLDGVALARSALVSYRDVDGKTLYGVLYYPPGHDSTRRYPLVAEIYESFFDNGWNENMQLVTARGFIGFRPSVEFETGYPGEAWLKGVPAAINALVDRGLVDDRQVGVYGQSYGGYAVNLLITQTHRFAAAANVSGKVNIISFLGDSEKITTRNYNAAEEGQDRIGATLWEQPQKYIATSAVMFADRIRTPLLLLSGEGDWNVPATNQREMYYALRRLGKDVTWVNYMRGGHGAGRASTVEDFHDHWGRLLDFMQAQFAKRAATVETR